MITTKRLKSIEGLESKKKIREVCILNYKLIVKKKNN